MRAVGALLVAAMLAGCGGDGDRDVAGDRPATVTLTQDDADATGAVDARLAVVAVRTPADELPVAVPRGAEAVIADVEVEDRGADPFPLRWAAFTARTRGGRTLREQLRLPARRVRAGVQLVPVGFAVPDGDALAELRVRSIVARWPFRATLPLPPAG